MTAGGLTNLVWSQATLVSDRELKCFNTYFALEFYWRCRKQHEMSTFSGNELKFLQSPLKAGVGISWTGSLAYFAELQFQCTVSDMFWFQFRSKTDNLKSYVFHYKLQLGPCTSWKVNEH